MAAIHGIKCKPASALALFNEHAGYVAISSITLAELLQGAEKSSAPARSLGGWRIFAAHARSEGLALVSNKLREFERVEALRWVNWVV